MQLYSWDNVRKEEMSDKIWRKFVTGEKATLAQIFIAKDGVVAPHHHESEQITYVTRGALKLQAEGQEVVARAGDVVHIPSNVTHGGVALEDTLIVEVFSPIRSDWITGQDNYWQKK